MERRHALMLGNRLVGISRLMQAGHTQAAQEQMDQLKINIDPVVIGQYQKAVTAAEKAYATADAEMLAIIGNGVIDSLLLEESPPIITR